jgi:hypothetical protein
MKKNKKMNRVLSVAVWRARASVVELLQEITVRWKNLQGAPEIT